MATLIEKRKKMMKLITDVFNAIDPSGTNAKLYNDKFNKMTDKAFFAFMKDFFDDPNKHFYLEVEEYERDVKYDDVERAAKVLGIPLYEKVFLPYVNNDNGKVMVTPQPVPVGYIHIKRMMQTLQKKNSGSTSIGKRSALTGQVVGDDKNARNSDVESYAMLAIGAEKALSEFLGPRSDDMPAKTEMYNSISKDGFVYLKDLNSKPENKRSLSTLDIYFISMGFKTNLITGGKMLPDPDS